VIFVDTNIFMYAVGGEHPLKHEAQDFLAGGLADAALSTSVEVLQELLHAYLRVGRRDELGDAWTLVESMTVWDVELDDLRLARTLAGDHVSLAPRDLVHLACCRRRKATGLHTYDRALAAAWAAA
jgi:uncharacterized protein